MIDFFQLCSAFSNDYSWLYFYTSIRCCKKRAETKVSGTLYGCCDPWSVVLAPSHGGILALYSHSGYPSIKLDSREADLKKKKKKKEAKTPVAEAEVS